jgi:NADH:ubiquinone oxidoreductase subunit H
MTVTILFLGGWELPFFYFFTSNYSILV